MKQTVEDLSRLIFEAIRLALEVKEKATERSVKSIFTISSTSISSEKRKPYLTPLRDLTHGIIGGTVVFSQTEAVAVAKSIDGIVDLVLVDAEKKLDITIGLQPELLAQFAIDLPDEGSTQNHVELGNLSSACFNYIKKSRFREFKPNDLTVEAVWNVLNDRFPVLSGKRIAIIGAGNIGFKLALKLVESGTSVEIVRRDAMKGMLLANTINVVKPAGTLAGARYNENPLHACVFSDAIVGCANETSVVSWEMIQCMNKSGIIVDVGKGCISEDAIARAGALAIPIVRCDVSAAIEGLISTIERHSEIVNRTRGRREVCTGVFVVSGGFMGSNGDIVVNNFADPTKVLGVANGIGDFRPVLNSHDKVAIDAVKNHFGIE